jgi:peptidoglycan/LPS O-acetylase OafA/YrhL
MRLDRRVPFFLFGAALCFALVPFADKGLRHVPIIVGIAYVMLAVLFLFDWLGRRSTNPPDRSFPNDDGQQG